MSHETSSEKLERDPVCGMSVDPLKAAAESEHAGKTYYFCSAGCAKRFSREPEKFLATPGTAGMIHGHSLEKLSSQEELITPSVPPVIPVIKNARYTCPMHPEVVQIGPG